MIRTLKAAALAIAATSLAITPAAFAPAHAQTQTVVEGLDGDWSGALDVQGQSMPLTLHVTTADAATTATLDSPAQAQMDIPVSMIARDGDKLNFEIEVAAGAYEGDIAPGGNSITGIWSQSGLEMALVFTRQ